MKNIAQKLTVMREGFFKRGPAGTAFVLLDTKKCEACWRCLDVCPNNALGRINLPWHKHIRFVNISACIGCMECVMSCRTGALSRSDKEQGV